MQDHWETIYKNKSPEEVSWTQYVPKPSLDFIEKVGLPKDASVIDVGGGDSRLVDHLLEKGYRDLTVLDLSEAALKKSRERLGGRAEEVEWLVSDVLEFRPERSYDLWHDRATFHFLTDEHDIRQYVDLVERTVNKYLLMATFSDQGPEKCSGLPVKRYDEESMHANFAKSFQELDTWREVHTTPDGKEQEFIFYTARRRS